MAKWIKVTDRLPKIGQKVLVVMDGFIELQEKAPAPFIDTDEVVSITISADGTVAAWTEDELKVTHWQPLPALPEVEGGKGG
jgi:hypothetical protein